MAFPNAGPLLGPATHGQSGTNWGGERTLARDSYKPCSKSTKRPRRTVEQ